MVKKVMSPRLMLIVSMTIFGSIAVFVRNIPVSSGELALYRAVLATLLIGGFLLVTRQKIPLAKIKKEIPLGKMGTIEDIGKIIAFLCQDRSSYITGEIIKADGGWI